jgi:hypothetical protein
MSDADFILSEIDKRRKHSIFTRLVLAALSVAQLVVALPWLFGSNGLFSSGSATVEHLTRDGVLGTLFALSGMAVAHETRRAWFALPLVMVLSLIQTFFGFLDHHHESASFTFELIHFMGLTITVLIATFVKPRSRPKNNLRVVK